MAQSDRDLLLAELYRRELAKRSYPEYLAYVQGPTWKRTRFSEYLAREVQDFVEADTGHSFDILVVQAPPQNGKSITITESFPSWYLGRYPERRIILAAYNDEFAERFLRRNKEKVKASGKNIFGIEVGKIDRATEFELTNGKGRIISRGLRSGITGNPGDLIILDDPIKDKMEAYSPTFREQLWGAWLGSIKTRLSAGAKVVVIATPWHSDDIMARIVARESNVRVIRLPIEAGENDPLGRKPGESLCPELGKDNKWLSDFKVAYLNDPEGGRAAWAAMFMCDPIIDGGNIVQRNWFKFYDPKEITEWGPTVISVDAAFKGNENNDFVAITVWSKLGAGYYLRHLSNKKLDFPQTLTELRMIKAMFPEAFTVLVEDKANGSAIISTLRHEMPGVLGVNPRGGKEARVHAVSGVIEAGNVYIPKDAPWQDDYLNQWAEFPAGKHDDMCFVAGTKIATPTGDRNIEDIRPGDKVLTPFGVDTVAAAGCTGEKPVLTRLGLTGTADHPVYAAGAFIPLSDLSKTVKYSVLSLKEMVLWQYKRLLSSTELHTDSWELADIISASRRPMKDDVKRKGFMSRCGSFIAGRQYLKGMRFITKMATLTTTTFLIWSVYRVSNIARCTLSAIRRNTRNISMKSDRLLLNGIARKRGERGIGSMPQTLFTTTLPRNVLVSSAEQRLSPMSDENIADTTVKSKPPIEPGRAPRPETVLSAGRSLRQKLHRGVPEQRPVAADAVQSFALRTNEKPLRKVYNLTVAKSHLYYANGFLVHNCDSTTQALTYMLYASGDPLHSARVIDEDERRARDEEEAFLDPDRCYDVYGQQDW